MKCRIVRVWDLIFVLLAFASATQIAQANSAQTHRAPEISGTYQVLQESGQGPQTHLRLQFRLVNHGQHNLHIQRLTLWDRHPEKGGTQACSIVIPAGRTVETTQQFTVAHPEYEMWQRGTEPRLVLEMQAPNGRKTTQTVRLSRITGGKAD